MAKRWMVALGAIVLAGRVAAAAEPSAESRALATKLLEVMQVQQAMEKQFDLVRKTQLDSLQAMTAGRDLSPEAMKRTRAMQDAVLELVNEELTWDKMKADFVSIYASTFDDAELQGLIDFYQTPIGRTLVAKTPEITERIAAVTSTQAIMPRLQALIMEQLRQAAPGVAPDDPT